MNPHPYLADYDPPDEPADMVLRTVRDTDRVLRERSALALRARYGDLDILEAEDLR